MEVGICTSSVKQFDSATWTKDMEHFLLGIAARGVNHGVKNALLTNVKNKEICCFAKKGVRANDTYQ